MESRRTKMIALGLPLGIFILYRLSTTSADPDLWGYMAFGRLFWSGQGFPYQDVFAYVPVLKPWIYHEWLTGVILAPIYDALGGFGLQVLKYLVGAGTALLAYRTARLIGAGPLGSGLALFIGSGVFTLGHSPFRAGILTCFLFVLTLHIMESARVKERYRRLAWLIPIQLVWANLHGGFVAGLGIVAFFGLGRLLARKPFRPYLLSGIGAGLATLVNPYGLDYWTYMLEALRLARPEIAGWRPVFQVLAQDGPTPAEVYFLIVAVLTLAFLLRARLKDLSIWLVLIITGAMAFRSVRNEIFFLLAVCVYLGPSLDSFSQSLASDENLSRLLARIGWKIPAGALIIGSLLLLGPIAAKEPLKLELRTTSDPAHTGVYYPVGSLKFIKDNKLKGNILPEFDWGEFLLFHLFPDCKVGMDGRYETVYPLAYHRAYFDWLYGRPGGQGFLDAFPHEMVLLKAHSRLRAGLESDPAWRRVFDDPGSVLFVRSGENRQPRRKEQGLKPPDAE